MTRLHWLYWPLIGIGAGLILYAFAHYGLAFWGFTKWLLRDEPLDEEW